MVLPLIAGATGVTLPSDVWLTKLGCVTGQAEEPPSGWRYVRRVGAGAILLFVVAACLASSRASAPRFSVCSAVSESKTASASAQAEAGSGSSNAGSVAVPATSSTVVSCRPLQITDPQVLVAVLLAMLLLLPDLKSLKIAGLVEIERSAVKAADAAAKASEAVTMHLQALARSESRASANINFSGTLPPGALIEVSEQDLDAKNRRFREQP